MKRGGVAFGLSGLVLAGLGTVALSGVARADVTWQHSIKVSVPGAPQSFKAVMQNSWTEDKSRTRFLINGLAGVPGPEMLGKPQSATIVQRLDQDKLLAWTSAEKSGLQAKRTTWLKGEPLDPWKTGATKDPQLEAQPVPELTLEQRQRLGREIRAALKPATKNAYKVYFRPLYQKQTYNGYTGEGYRMTALVNAGSPKAPQWTKAAFEWWIARDLPGDETIRNFSQKAYETKKGKPTTSMWLNEMGPVFVQSLPEGLLQAIETFSAPEGSPREGFAGTPLRLYAAFYLPENALMSTPGDDTAVRLSVALTGRSTSPVPAGAFASPVGYKFQDISPDKLKKEAEAAAKKRGVKMPKMPGALLPLASFVQNSSWDAWNTMMRQTRERFGF